MKISRRCQRKLKRLRGSSHYRYEKQEQIWYDALKEGGSKTLALIIQLIFNGFNLQTHKSLAPRQYLFKVGALVSYVLWQNAELLKVTQYGRLGKLSTYGTTAKLWGIKIWSPSIYDLYLLLILLEFTSYVQTPYHFGLWQTFLYLHSGTVRISKRDRNVCTYKGNKRVCEILT